jgi:hypothetical protein
MEGGTTNHIMFALFAFWALGTGLPFLSPTENSVTLLCFLTEGSNKQVYL